MRITELNKPLTAEALNESVAQKFGQRINLDSFTLEQLEDARNKLRTQLSQFENSENYNAVYEDETYTKNKMFLDVLNRAIEERGSSATIDSEYTEMESMVLEKVEQGLIAFEDLPEELQAKVNSKQTAVQVESVLREGEEEKAELIMAARDMVTRVTGWMEDTANMQAESMLELIDSIRDELGSDTSMEFEGVVKPALASIYTALEGSRQQLTQAVAILTGEGGGGEMMGAEPAGEEPAGEELPPEEGETVVGGGPGSEEEIGAAAPAAGGEEAAGRPTRESIEFSRKLASLLAPKKK
jgi:hypothetical protein